jgi:uncharacterized repeat protein (TIGR04052 family)
MNLAFKAATKTIVKIRNKTKTALLSLATLLPLVMLSGCDSESTNETSMTSFSLDFTAVSGAETVSCDSTLSGFGADEEYSVGVRDLRFYVSNVVFYDQYDEEIEMTFDDSDFQLNHEDGFVGLIDLTSNTSGTCTANSGAGTERTNTTLTGTMLDTGVSKVTFDIGVPQAVMKDVISTSSAEDAPSPLNEMYWSWASGYRHFLMNFAIENTSALAGEGYVHIGSKGCGDDGLLALENKDSCDYVNTPQVELTDFDPSVNTVVIDVNELLTDVVFSSTSEEGVETLLVACHSASPAMQPNCSPIFSNLGLDTDDGTAVASDNNIVTFK